MVILDVSDNAPEVTKASDKTNDVTRRKCDVTIASASVIKVDDSMTSPKPVNGVIDLCDTTNSTENGSGMSSGDSAPGGGSENQSKPSVSVQNGKCVSAINDSQLFSSQSSQHKGTSRKETLSTMHTSTPITANGSCAVVPKFGAEGSALVTPQASSVRASVSDTPSSAQTSNYRYQLISHNNGRIRIPIAIWTVNQITTL